MSRSISSRLIFPLCCCVVRLCGILPSATALINPFDLANVTLATTTAQSRAASLNLEYLLMIEPDRLLWNFRKNAGLDAPSSPYTGSWEDPRCELRGHFAGHYLSALSLAYRATGEQELLSRVDYMVQTLAAVQTAIGRDGYLSAFPEELFDRLQNLQPVWAPYYTIHKIMAGLMDAYQLAGNPLAFDVVTRMANYFLQRITLTLATNGTEHWHQMLQNEFGGMNDVMYRMYEASGNPEHLFMGTLFDKPAFWDPLLAGQDPLGGLHANTHLAQVNGFVARRDAMRDAAAESVVSTFFNAITAHHSYATGGSNDHEYWGRPDALEETLRKQEDATETQETCTQYNMLKIARSLFTWTGDVRYADYYERALVNGILGVQRLPEPHHDKQDVHEMAAPVPDNLSAWTLPPYERKRGPKRLQEAEPGSHAYQEQHNHHMHMPRRPEGLPDQGHYHHHHEEDDYQHHHHHEEKDYQHHHEEEDHQQLGGHDDSPGPGVYLYLLPLGAGQSKGESTRLWGTPEHAFWCCYGTAVESFAKLHDSIFFQDMQPPAGLPRLYVNQYVSSSVAWMELQVAVTMTADMYAAGPSTRVSLQVSSQGSPVSFALMLRIASWVGDTPSVKVNGMTWDACPGLPVPGYCQVSRPWSNGDILEAVLPMPYRLAPLPGRRPQQYGLQAITLGPYVMAGLTHDTRLAVLPSGDVNGVIHEPDSGNSVSMQALWNASLFIRHDLYHLFASMVRDNGDGIDSTFFLRSGLCHNASSDLNVVLLESLNVPGFFIAFDDTDALVLADRSRSNASEFCRRSALVMRTGLAASYPNSTSLESLARPGYYVSAYMANSTKRDPGKECVDDNPRCQEWAARGECDKNPGYMLLQCRLSCHACDILNAALSLQPLLTSPQFATASSFFVAAPRAQLPHGSKVLRAANRQYILAPLANLVDERYTAYFNVTTAAGAVEASALHVGHSTAQHINAHQLAAGSAPFDGTEELAIGEE